MRDAAGREKGTQTNTKRREKRSSVQTASRILPGICTQNITWCWIQGYGSFLAPLIRSVFVCRTCHPFSVRDMLLSSALGLGLGLGVLARGPAARAAGRVAMAKQRLACNKALAAQATAAVPLLATSLSFFSFRFLHSSDEPTEPKADVQAASKFIRNVTQKEPVVVFSALYCPFCTAAKDLFQDLDVSYTAFELDKGPGEPHGAEAHATPCPLVSLALILSRIERLLAPQQFPLPRPCLTPDSNL